MKISKLFLLIPAILLISGCANLTPQQTAAIQTTEKTLALAAQIAAPLVGNKQISDSLYAVAAVANSYGNNPVPTTILQATTQLPAIAGVVLPLVTGSNNSSKTSAIISGAAQILAATQTP